MNMKKIRMFHSKSAHFLTILRIGGTFQPRRRCRDRNVPITYIIALFLFVFCASGFAQDKIVAIVNNEVITQNDLDEFVKFTLMELKTEYSEEQLSSQIPSMRQELLDRLIDDRIILQEAKNNKISVDNNRISAKIAEIKKHYPSEAAFQEGLKRQGMAEADLENKIRDQLLMYSIIDSKIRPKVVIRPSEVTEFYAQHAQDFQFVTVWEMDSLSLDEEAKAVEISDAVKKGGAFDDLAKKYSLAINKLKARKGELRKDVEDALLKLKPQEVSEPIKIENKYYLFRMNNIIPARQQSLSDSQDTIYTLLYNKKMQEEMVKWLDELKKHAYIKKIASE